MEALTELDQAYAELLEACIRSTCDHEKAWWEVQAVLELAAERDRVKGGKPISTRGPDIQLLSVDDMHNLDEK